MASSKVNILENPQLVPEKTVDLLQHVLEPPTGESDTESKDSPSTRLLSCSHPHYSVIGVPVPASGQSIDPEESEQRADESSNNRCSTFLDWYTNTVINFRNSCFIHVIHILFSCILISAIIMGLMFPHECSLTSYLPIYVTVVGVVGTVIMGFWIAVACYERRGTPCSNLQTLALGILLTVLFKLSVIEMCFVGTLSPNFDPSAEDYCSKTFYYYLVGKEIMSGAAIILAALLYFPGCSIHTWCQYCSIPSPAGAL